MLPLRFLAAIPLVLLIRAPIDKVHPGVTPPAPQASATPAAVGKGPVEKVLTGTDEAMIWVTSQNPRVKIETHRGVSFYLDLSTHSAMCLAHMSVELSVQPPGLTLSFNPTNGVLSAGYNKETKELQVLMNNGKDPVCKLPLALSTVPTRVLIRQRDQLALFVIPPDGSHVTLVWLGSIQYLLTFRNAAQYELCQDVKITMGKKEVPEEEFRKGIKLQALDEIADVVVAGTSPTGDPFKHRYTFDYKNAAKLVDDAYGSFMKAAGNATTGQEAAVKTAPMEFSQ